jgi:hypothetical protein
MLNTIIEDNEANNAERVIHVMLNTETGVEDF